MNILKSYNLHMEKKTIGDWLFEKFQEYERKKGRRVTQTEFAKALDINQGTLSSWMNETRKPSAEAALELAAKLDDPEILSILGYSVPDDSSPSLPPSLKESFNKAVDEIEREYKTRGITDLSSPEALEIAKTIFEAHGWSVTT